MAFHTQYLAPCQNNRLAREAEHAKEAEQARQTDGGHNVMKDKRPVESALFNLHKPPTALRPIFCWRS